MYDVQNEDSFKAVEDRFLPEIIRYGTETATILVIGNCCESVNRVVTPEQGQALATKAGAMFVEISLKNDINVDSSVEMLLRGMYGSRSVAAAPAAIALAPKPMPKKSGGLFKFGSRNKRSSATPQESKKKSKDKSEVRLQVEHSDADVVVTSDQDEEDDDAAEEAEQGGYAGIQIEITDADLALAQEATAQCMFIKVVIAGEGRAGKTTTQRSLLGKSFVADQETTNGISICSAVLDDDSFTEHDLSKGQYRRGVLNAVMQRKLPSNNQPPNNTAVPSVPPAAQPQPPTATTAESRGVGEGDQPATPRGLSSRPSLAVMARNVQAMVNTSEEKPVASSSMLGAVEVSTGEVTGAPTNDTVDGKHSGAAEGNGKKRDSKQVNQPNVESEQFLGKVALEDSEISDAIQRRQEHKSDPITALFYDCGGQNVYQTANELFFTPRAVVMLVFNMQTVLQSDDLTTLRGWLCTIALHTPTSAIILIGTRSDMVRNRADHVRVSSMLRASFGNTSYWQQVVQRDEEVAFVPVDNTKGVKDSGIKALQVLLLKVVRAQPLFQELFPVKWLNCLDATFQCQDSVLTVEQFKTQITRKCGVPDGEVLNMCSQFHRLGFLAWYDDPKLSHMVITKPQAVIDAIAMIISMKSRLLNSGVSCQAALRSYVESGEVRRFVLDALWDKGNVRPEFWELYCQLMLRFDLLCELVPDSSKQCSLLEISRLKLEHLCKLRTFC
eukprot:c19747_g1_i1.p1 GENE.c19747_g1_i1~~c19747_g1_i1.p1  ORF type:complete len:751 (+),score=194.93 c19747_g1_i1:77-2254(+)